MPTSQSKTYIPLEPSFSQALVGTSSPGFSSDQAISLFTSTSFLYSLGIMISVVAAGVMYARAGIWRMEASDRGIRKSNEEIKRTTIGLLGILSLFVIIYTFNKDLLTGDVGLDKLASTRVETGGTTAGGGAGQDGTTLSSGGGASCTDKQAVISSLTSPGGVCGNTSCSALSGCRYEQYSSLITAAVRGTQVSRAMVIAIMCRESKGDRNATHQNGDGTYDCGLMQINRQGQCDQASLDPASNIAAGVSKIARALSSASQVYPNIPQTLGAFASYNCCSNGTVPNAPSVDCTQSSGFPYTIPKWACPINPGTSSSNMCAVKAYACDVQACINQLGN